MKKKDGRFFILQTAHRPLPVVDPVANLTLHTTGLYLTPLEPQVGVGSVPDCHARWWI